MRIRLPESGRRIAFAVIGCTMSLAYAQAQTTGDTFSAGIVAPRGCVFAKKQLNFTTPKEFTRISVSYGVPPVSEDNVPIPAPPLSNSSSREFLFKNSHGEDYFGAATDSIRSRNVTLIPELRMYPPSDYELLCGLHGFNDSK